MGIPDIFDRAKRRARRDRAAATFADHDFVRAAMFDAIAERLSSVKREFSDILEIGSADLTYTPPYGARIARTDPGYRFAARAKGVQADEDRLPFADSAFDFVIAAGTLDTVNDLPGALTLIRRTLRPDGLFIGAFLGAGTLATLRAIFREAEAEQPAARFHPQIDVRSAGDLLVRAGFALPVADTETLKVRYATMARLFDDLRGMAAASLLADPPLLTRTTLARAADAFAARADAGGRVTEYFEIVTLTGWSPSPDQLQPARRGSATASLADILKSRS